MNSGLNPLLPRNFGDQLSTILAEARAARRADEKKNHFHDESQRVQGPRTHWFLARARKNPSNGSRAWYTHRVNSPLLSRPLSCVCDCSISTGARWANILASSSFFLSLSFFPFSFLAFSCSFSLLLYRSRWGPRFSARWIRGNYAGNLFPPPPLALHAQGGSLPAL